MALFLAVNVLVTVADAVKTPLLLLVNVPMEFEQRSKLVAGSKLHWTMNPETPFPPVAKPAPVSVIWAGLERLSPSFGATSRVTLGLPPGMVSGDANAAPTVPTVKAMTSAMARL